MKAAVLVRPGIIEVQEIDIPRIKPHEVLVKVAYCGICGSDIPRVFNNASRFYPNVLGHEFSGFVVDVGSSDHVSLLNQRVMGIPLIPCMECKDCRRGNYALCECYSFIGSRQFGAFAEYVVMPAKNVISFSPKIDYLTASMIEPATVAMHAISLTKLTSNATVLIMGCGTIGNFVVQILKSRGVGTVVACGRNETRLAASRSCGADFVFDTNDSGWEKKVCNVTENTGFDYVFETSGSNTFMPKSFELVGNKGTICMIGTPKHDITFTVSEWECLNRKELTLLGSWMSYSEEFPGQAWSTVVDLFENGEMFFTQDMIDSVYSLKDAPRAFGRFNCQEPINGKIIVKCNDMR